MKKRILVLVAAFLLIGINGFAADEDLIVKGKVGIGTTNPGYKLDVQGQIRATQGTAVYTMPKGCGNGLTTSATCPTLVCPAPYDGSWYYDCAGLTCSSYGAATCQTTLVGRLVAP